MFSFVPSKFSSSLLLITVIFSFSGISAVSAADLFADAQDILPVVTLKTGSNLKADGDEARKKQIPILLFFSMEHCPFCNEVEEDYLKPILRNSDYDSKVIIRKIKIDDSQFVQGFNGKDREAGEFSDDYNISMVPTLIIVDANGNKIAPSIIGIANRHYYSAELDDAIDTSTQELRAIAKR